MTNGAKSDRNLLLVLLTLCLIPVLSGGFRLFSIIFHGSAEVENLNYLANPIPIAVHMIAYMAFCVFGTFQIAPVFRRRHIQLHRLMGRMLVPIGFFAAISGIWMTLNYPPIPSNGETVGYVRIAFGLGMIVCLAFGVVAIRRRNIHKHQLWMLRSYAIGLGASTQAIVAIPWFVLIGEPQGLPWASTMALVWLFNLAAAELFMKSQHPHSPVTS